MAAAMFQKLDEILAKYRAIEIQLADPAIMADVPRYTRTAKEYGSLAKVAKPYLEYQQLTEKIAETESVAAGEKDADMRKYIEDELAGMRTRQKELYDKLEDLL